MNLVLSMAVRLECGSVFPTFEHFLETFKRTTTPTKNCLCVKTP